MKIDFYFDPVCPFCWITSRWLLLVEPHRDIIINWKPFSLALKNNCLEQSSSETPHSQSYRKSHRVLRVILAAEKRGAKLIDLYTDFGIAKHLEDANYEDELIAKILARHNLPADLINSADDSSLDSIIADSIDSATSVAGKDIGVPTIVFTNEKDEKQGYFGPVLQKLPPLAESLDLWDGLSKLASSSAFYELKRARPGGRPDVDSTQGAKNLIENLDADHNP